MANIPTINRTSLAYTRVRTTTAKKVNPTEAGSDQTEAVRERVERRRKGDRRRRNIQVSFNRRKLKDRRHRASPDTDPSGSTVRRGNRINTTA